VGCVILVDHLHARAAVLSDLVDVGPLHQAQADVCVPQAVCSARLAFAVEAKLLLLEDGFEKLALSLRENYVGRFGRAPLSVRNSRCVGGSCGRVRAINARRAEPPEVHRAL
jgi:hypothetical protein